MPHEMIQHLDLNPGAEYDYAPWFKVPGAPGSERRRCGRYRILGVAYTGRTRQQQIVYEGLTGADAGLWFTASTFDFAMRFLPAEAISAVEKKEADLTTKGRGV